MFDDDLNVIFVWRKERADIRAIRNWLRDICEKEATYLFRLAWKMQKHGCSADSVRKCRDEARVLHMIGKPEMILDDSVRWEYAFKI